MRGIWSSITQLFPPNMIMKKKEPWKRLSSTIESRLSKVLSKRAILALFFLSVLLKQQIHWAWIKPSIVTRTKQRRALCSKQHRLTSCRRVYTPKIIGNDNMSTLRVYANKLICILTITCLLSEFMQISSFEYSYQLWHIMPLYGHVYLISICKLDVICINSESRHVIVTK